jgi:chromosome segregation ATPase
LPPKQFEFNNQAELLSQIERLQKELSESKGTVQELTQELDDVYSEKDLAIHKLDRLIESAKLKDSRDEEHEQLREIRMYLTDRTEPTISSITTGGDYHQPGYHQASESYHPFCSCLRSN